MKATRSYSASERPSYQATNSSVTTTSAVIAYISNPTTPALRHHPLSMQYVLDGIVYQMTSTDPARKLRPHDPKASAGRGVLPNDGTWLVNTVPSLVLPQSGPSGLLAGHGVMKMLDPELRRDTPYLQAPRRRLDDRDR